MPARQRGERWLASLAGELPQLMRNHIAASSVLTIGCRSTAKSEINFHLFLAD